MIKFLHCFVEYKMESHYLNKLLSLNLYAKQYQGHFDP